MENFCKERHRVQAPTEPPEDKMIQMNIDARIAKVLPILHELLQFNYGAQNKSFISEDSKRVSVSLRLDSGNDRSAAADAVGMFCHIRSYISSMRDYDISDYKSDSQYIKGRYGVYFVIYYR